MPLLTPPPQASRAYLGDSGIVIGDTDFDGVQWIWPPGNGTWGASPAPREQTGDNVAANGQWDATEFYGAATRTFAGIAEGDHEALHRAEQRLKAAVSVRAFTLRIVEPGFDRWATVRRGGEVLWDETDPGSAAWSISLFQKDPCIYAVDPYTDSTGLPQQSGGLVWPATWPATWAATVTSGMLVVTNDGTVMSYPVFRVYGPLPDFSLSNPDTGETLIVDLGADGDALAAGEWLDIDMGLQKVMLLGQSPRRRAVRGSFFGLPPGETAVLLGSSVSNTTAFATVEGHSTWI